ncbi:hypothetical protein [Streptomyces sp. NPDC019937]|uniref:hypothetical protein n=1 Tax=Streptomyces sp. NPDC019937 TaxID=3154787 RepID=UPI0033DFB01F
MTNAEANAALAGAFPSRLAHDVRTVLTVMPGARPPITSTFSVDVSGEVVSVPYRIYHDEPLADTECLLTATQRLVLHCLYSRHSDGRVRQRHLEQITGSGEPWMAPFVVQLVGEYVVEILEAIQMGISDVAAPGSAQRLLFGDFVARNASYFARTERRVVSYWSCYHRHQYPTFGTYPGCLLLDILRAAAADRTGRRWPRHTPRGLTSTLSPCLPTLPPSPP